MKGAPKSKSCRRTTWYCINNCPAKVYTTTSYPCGPEALERRVEREHCCKSNNADVFV